MAKRPQVAKLKRKRDVSRLVEALSFREIVPDRRGGAVDLGAPVRGEALAALAELGEEAAVGPVAGLLADPDPRVRATAVRALRILSPSPVADALLAGVLNWSDPPYGRARVEALATLEQLDDPGLARRMVDAVARRNGDVVVDATTRRALLALAGHPDGDPREVVRQLVDLLRSSNGSRSAVEVMLTWLPDHSLEPVLDGLADPTLRESAARVLGGLRDSRAVPALAAQLDDERPSVRLAIVRALGEIRDPRAVEPLLRASADRHFTVRRTAQETLDALGGIALIAGVSAAVRPLVTSLGRPDANSTEVAQGDVVPALPMPTSPEDGNSQTSWAPLRRLLDRF